MEGAGGENGEENEQQKNLNRVIGSGQVLQLLDIEALSPERKERSISSPSGISYGQPHFYEPDL